MELLHLMVFAIAFSRPMSRNLDATTVCLFYEKILTSNVLLLQEAEIYLAIRDTMRRKRLKRVSSILVAVRVIIH
jgi:hypothetical protein